VKQADVAADMTAPVGLAARAGYLGVNILRNR
jgi:hypothetical protein